MVFISIVALPALLAVPTHIAIKQFDTIYQIDKVSSPPSCFFTAANFFNLSCNYPSVTHAIIESQGRKKRHLLAGVCTEAVVAFTYVILETTSRNCYGWRSLEVRA